VSERCSTEFGTCPMRAARSDANSRQARFEIARKKKDAAPGVGVASSHRPPVLGGTEGRWPNSMLVRRLSVRYLRIVIPQIELSRLIGTRGFVATLPAARDLRSDTGGQDQEKWGRARGICRACAGQEAIVRTRPQRGVERWGAGEQGQEEGGGGRARRQQHPLSP
jgi:hypothetical protein